MSEELKPGEIVWVQPPTRVEGPIVLGRAVASIEVERLQSELTSAKQDAEEQAQLADGLMKDLTSAKQQIEELTKERDEALKRLETIVWQKENWETRYHRDNSRLAARCAELESEAADARTVQKQLASERATALEALAGERRRIELSKATASEVWATHEKQFADQQEKLDKALGRIAELESEAARLREVLVKIRADYDHPWPIEDASTRTYRLGVIAAIDAAMSERDGK